MRDLSVNLLTFRGENCVQKSLNKIRPKNPKEKIK
jgi:hypothetical protein